jgi:hypothetical protein
MLKTRATASGEPKTMIELERLSARILVLPTVTTLGTSFSFGVCSWGVTVPAAPAAPALALEFDCCWGCVPCC